MARIKVAVEVEDVFDVSEAASQLGIGIATAWRWIRDDKLPSFKLEGRTLVPGCFIRAIQNERATETQAALPGLPTSGGKS
jgi:predicted site-specific integrase-resolvase